jgi:hypothetical protein
MGAVLGFRVNDANAGQRFTHRMRPCRASNGLMPVFALANLTT